jgi:hypothetical protein
MRIKALATHTAGRLQRGLCTRHPLHRLRQCSGRHSERGDLREAVGIVVRSDRAVGQRRACNAEVRVRSVWAEGKRQRVLECERAPLRIVAFVGVLPQPRP